MRGVHQRVQILHSSEVVAEQDGHTNVRVAPERRHYEGEATERVVPPSPLGRNEDRPVDLYVARAEGLAR